MVTRQEYQRIRKNAAARIRRLSSAGFKAPGLPPSSRGLSDKEIEKEYKKLSRWMEKETSTVKGARAQKERQLERRRERRAEKAAIEKEIQAGIAQEQDKKVRTALQNLLKGLRKYKIPVKSYAELRAWGAYIKERNNDRKRAFYKFDLWLDEAEESIGVSRSEIQPDDIYELVIDFSEWSANQENLKEEYLRERQANEYTAEEVGDMWSAYLKN